MTEQCKHEWQLIFKPDSFRRVRCKHCPEQMLDYEIERRLNATERLSAEMKDGADEYDKACVVAVAQGLMTGNVELTRALQTMVNFTGRIIHILEGK